MKQLSVTILFFFCLNMTFSQKLPFHFDAKGLVVLSDADMVASAYIDGQLKTEQGVTDALSAIRMDSILDQINISTLEVPNSVTNWVNGMDISNDGRYAFVVDTKGSLPRSVQKVGNVFEDLPTGNRLFAIDLSDITHPKQVAQLNIPQTPLSVDVHPVSGDLLIVCGEKGKEVLIVKWNDGQFEEMKVYDMGMPDNVITHGSWHPEQAIFGLTLEKSQEVAFFEVNPEGELQANGKPVKAGTYPGAAVFSNKGKYYLVPDLKWDKGYDVNGDLIAIAFDEKSAQHRFASKVELGISPEGFAISPNGKFIAVSNMGTNFMPYDFPLFGQKASVSLLSFDENKGTFQTLDEQHWEGILPEGITFDNSSQMLSVTSFDHLDLSQRRGSLSFWKIANEAGEAKLEDTGFRISLRRGSHYVRIIK
ncbi:MAG: hypothetical protein AAF242_06825 [Bacteroidota bacterium]